MSECGDSLTEHHTVLSEIEKDVDTPQTFEKMPFEQSNDHSETSNDTVKNDKEIDETVIEVENKNNRSSCIMKCSEED